MPPSFPYGGMENPRLTFLTPTLLAGDRSLVSVVAHELAHSWTGNLVSNASAEHFWLNEGFTVFAERRIVEALYGAETCALQAALGRRALDEALERFAAQPELTRLRTQLDGIDPDEVFSEVPYEKGYLFLRAIEEAVGARGVRSLLARVRRPSSASAPSTATTSRGSCERELPGALGQASTPSAWLDGAGLPASAPTLRAAQARGGRARSAAAGGVADGASWRRRGAPTEWELYLDVAAAAVRRVRRRSRRAFALTAKRNYEVLVAWLLAGDRVAASTRCCRASRRCWRRSGA